MKGRCIVTDQRTVPCTAVAVQHSTGGRQIRRDGGRGAFVLAASSGGVEEGSGQLLWVEFMTGGVFTRG